MSELKESVCPECGYEMPLHGGVEWEDEGPAQCDEEGYVREFDGTFLSEYYTCDECGAEWVVTRDVEDEYAEDIDTGERLEFDALCPECDIEDVESTDWGEELLMGDRVEVEMGCFECGAAWVNIFPLGEPYIE